MQEILKTILISCAVFMASYVWFNFELLLDKQSQNDLARASIVSTHAFPISPEKVPTIKETPETTPNLINEMKTSSYLTIPSLGISAPIIFEPTTVEDRIYKQLEKGVVHYAGTPLPGQSGTAIILGHSSVYPWYKGKYGYIFSSLSKLKNGDIIKIEKNGIFANYRVSGSLIFSPKSADDYQLRGLELTNGSAIVLMTCWPNGTNAKRIAVRADLI